MSTEAKGNFPKIPFTIYDFFGYLFPGGILWVLIFFIEDFSFLIRHSIWGVSKRPESGFLFEGFSKAFNQTLFINTLLVLLVSYITGHIVSSLSSYLFERVVVERFMGYPAVNLFRKRHQSKIKNKPKNWIIKLSSFIFRASFGKYFRPYTEEFIKQYEIQFEKRFMLKATNGSDLFWLSFEYIADNCPVSLARSLHFLNLYGFSRNLSMTFFTAAFIQGCSGRWIELVVFLALSFFLFLNYLKLIRRCNDEVFRGFYVKSVSDGNEVES